jgi:hypothetical protein
MNDLRSHFRKPRILTSELEFDTGPPNATPGWPPLDRQNQARAKASDWTTDNIPVVLPRENRNLYHRPSHGRLAEALVTEFENWVASLAPADSLRIQREFLAGAIHPRSGGRANRPHRPGPAQRGVGGMGIERNTDHP